MGELLLHILYGALLYPVFYAVLSLSHDVGISLFRFNFLSLLRAPMIVYYVPRIAIPALWIFMGFSFGPEPKLYGRQDPNSALASIYIVAWLFCECALAVKAYMDYSKNLSARGERR